MQKKKIYFMLACVLFVSLIGCSTSPTKEDVEKKAMDFFEALQKESVENVIDTFGDKEWIESVSVEMVEENISLRGQTLFDTFNIDEIQPIQEGKTIVDGSVTSPEATSEVRLILTQQLAVSSLAFQTPVAHLAFPDSIVEEDITIGEGTEFPLDGTMTYPKSSTSKMPVVILVHGSGPTDRDESAYAYKPFRDIAWGLAEHSIASIRYDKRTFVYGNDAFTDGIKKMNVQEETIDDVLRAVDTLLDDPRIDRDEIYVVGHSLGAMLAPRIVKASGDVAGIVSLAGSPRLLSDIILDQQRLLLEEQSIPKTVYDEQRTEIDEIEKQTEEIFTLSEEEILSTHLLGVSAYYFWEMSNHPVGEILSTLDVPMYILQGDKDFQVFKEKDYAAWKTLLATKKEVSFTSYPTLNHFFIEHQEGAETALDAYTYPGTVSVEVINDIATWIHGQ